MCQNSLVPALDAGPQKDRPYQSDFYRAGFNAIPRQAREQDSFDIPPFNMIHTATTKGAVRVTNPKCIPNSCKAMESKMEAVAHKPLFHVSPPKAIAHKTPL